MMSLGYALPAAQENASIDENECLRKIIWAVGILIATTVLASG